MYAEQRRRGGYSRCSCLRWRVELMSRSARPRSAWQCNEGDDGCRLTSAINHPGVCLLLSRGKGGRGSTISPLPIQGRLEAAHRLHPPPHPRRSDSSSSRSSRVNARTPTRGLTQRPLPPHLRQRRRRLLHLWRRGVDPAPRSGVRSDCPFLPFEESVEHCASSSIGVRETESGGKVGELES